jgi:3-oxoacyl-[acyl-carrier protein] reductase
MDDKRLSKKTALVTGGSRGIGAAIVERFAAEGADILFTYASNHAAAQRMVARGEAHGVKIESLQADLGDVAMARTIAAKAREQLGGLDILVHNAGVATYATIDGLGDGDYLEVSRRNFAVNVDGVVALTKAALPLLRDGGRVIIIGSVNAHTMPFPGVGIYGASKAAAAALARGWARDLGGRGILVNVIQPGPIDTEMNPDDDRDAVKHMTAMTALKRYGKPHEIAALATFLASDESSYITGSTLDIDGGMSV